MAAKGSRTTRVTTVDPWIVGGDGRLVDLFPFPAWLILLGRFVICCFKHPIRTLVPVFTIYIYQRTDFSSIFLLLTPLLIYLAIAIVHIAFHWYYSPDVPLIRRKQ